MRWRCGVLVPVKEVWFVSSSEKGVASALSVLKGDVGSVVVRPSEGVWPVGTSERGVASVAVSLREGSVESVSVGLERCAASVCWFR